MKTVLDMIYQSILETKDEKVRAELMRLYLLEDKYFELKDKEIKEKIK